MKFMDDDDDDNAIICLCDIQTQREIITIQSYCSDSNYNGYNSYAIFFAIPSLQITFSLLLVTSNYEQ